MALEGLRIALVGPAPPPAGGMAMQTLQLARLLSAEGATVLHVVSNAPCRPAWLAGVRGLRAVARLLGFLVSLWRALGRCNVVHLMANSGWNWHLVAAPTLLLGRLRGVPVVVNYRGGGAGEFLAGGSTLVRLGMRLAARLIVPSGFLVEVFAHHGMRAEVVPNIIDLARFAPRPPRDPASAHLVVARHLEALYDNATALRAFARVRAAWPAARLTIAGAGPERARLEALATELGVASAVHFAGGLPREAMAALFGGADLSLNPSRADNMPNSVLESMASGVPVQSQLRLLGRHLRSGSLHLLDLNLDPTRVDDVVPAPKPHKGSVGIDFNLVVGLHCGSPRHRATDVQTAARVAAQHDTGQRHKATVGAGTVHAAQRHMGRGFGHAVRVIDRSDELPDLRLQRGADWPAANQDRGHAVEEPTVAE